jgi:hypothetical protein
VGTYGRIDFDHPGSGRVRARARTWQGRHHWPQRAEQVGRTSVYAAQGGPVSVGITAPAAWYPDPQAPNSGALRWWDGARWTGCVHPSVLATGSGSASTASLLDEIRLPAAGRQRVVGEHSYQAAFRSISRGKVVPRAGDEGCWESSLSVIARLIAEDNNPYDRTAVRVDVDGRTVGYLPREDAAGLHHQLAAVHRRGTQTACEGRIVLASNGEYAIYLHLSDSDAVGFALALSDDYISVDGPFHAEVSGEQHHQDVLRQVGPPAGGEKTVVATLAFCDVAKGKYAGEQAVEVRIGGQRIGQLSRIMSAQPHHVSNLRQLRGRHGGGKMWVRGVR